jgi:hypothetical protein
MGENSFQRDAQILLSEGMMIKRPVTESNSYELTPKGKAWVEMICATPYPVKSEEWVDPRHRPVPRFISPDCK